MRLTTARYYTPSGRSIQKSGIDPDIEVQPAKLEEIDASGIGIREADLRGALDNDTLKKKDKKDKDKGKDGKEGKDGKDGKDKDVNKKDEEEKPYDNQLDRALDLIRGIHLFSEREPSKSFAKLGDKTE